MADEKMWVKSKTGKPLGLVDMTYFQNGEPQRIQISKEMAEKGIAVEVTQTTFIDGKIAEKLLEVIDAKEAKSKYTAYVEKTKKDKKEQDTETAEIEKAVKQITDDIAVKMKSELAKRPRLKVMEKKKAGDEKEKTTFSMGQSQD